MSLSLSVDFVARALAAWSLPAPPVISDLGEGFAGEVWLVAMGAQRYVAKLCYDTPEAFEVGLRMAEIVALHGIPSGAPLRTRSGALSVLLPHPPGHRHPLALLHFVPGHPLDLAAPDAGSRVGGLLGRVHRILHADVGIAGPRDAQFAYLTEERPEVFARYPWLRPLMLRAVEAVRSFEATVPVTYGPIINDNLEILHDSATDRLGLIDWSAGSLGPLMFDLAIVDEQFRRAGVNARGELHANYASAAPVTREELRGLDLYRDLLWARQARYFAWRLVHEVTRGGSHSLDGERTLLTYRRLLERSTSPH